MPKQKNRSNTKSLVHKVTKPAPKWASPRNTTVAAKHFKPPTRTAKDTPAARDQPLTRWELDRREMVLARNQARRGPWLASAATALVATTGSAVAWLYETIGAVNATGVANVLVVLMVIATAVGCCVAHRARQTRFLPDLLAGGAVAATTVWWVTTAGWGWAPLGFLLVGTLAAGYRWRAAHPLGPGVPALEPPRPVITLPDGTTQVVDEQTPTGVVPDALPTNGRTTAKQPQPVDQYIADWNEYLAKTREDLLYGATLTGREVTEFIRTYDVQLVRVKQTVRKLLGMMEEIASGLNITTEQLLIEKHRGVANRARLTIITKDPVAEPRFFTGPRVEDGRIVGLARYRDGKGEAGVTIWNAKGMRAVAVIGSTGGGKSAFANILVCCAMSTGVLNLLYVDPKGNSSGAMVDRARIAILGEAAALRAPELLQVIIEARQAFSTKNRRDLLFPTDELPGWIYLHDEMSVVLKGNRKVQQRHAKQANIVRSLGVWPVTMNQSLAVEDWGSDHARAGYTTQAVVFYVNSKSGDRLIPGLDYRPNQLPLDDDGEPVPGMAVFARTGRSNVPARCDWLPTDDDKVKQNGEEIEPPYRTSSAFDEFFNAPEMAKIDYDALVAAYGPPVDGRWVFGPGGTHEFPKPGKKRGGRGTSSTSIDDDDDPADPLAGLKPGHKFLFHLVSDGVNKVGEIEQAVEDVAEETPRLRMSRTTIHKYLGELVDRGLIEKTGRGLYVLCAADHEDEEDTDTAEDDELD